MELVQDQNTDTGIQDSPATEILQISSSFREGEHKSF